MTQTSAGSECSLDRVVEEHSRLNKQRKKHTSTLAVVEEKIPPGIPQLEVKPTCARYSIAHKIDTARITPQDALNTINRYVSKEEIDDVMHVHNGCRWKLLS